MPLLSCTTRTCMYNKDEYCSKGDILVDGDFAKTPDETCCRSFVERKEGADNSVAGTPSQSIAVDCRATKCTFNCREKCDADRITITGTGAMTSGDTKCGSFDKEA